MINPILPVYKPPQDIIFEKGKGVYLITKEGEKYLDFMSGIAVNCLGHCHPALVKTLKKQSKMLWHTSNAFVIENGVKLAEKLCKLTFADSMFFTNSGAESIECAIKMARKYHHETGQPKRDNIITFDGAFHGRTLGAIAATGTDKMLDGYEPRLEGFTKIPTGDLKLVEKNINKRTAGILIEPIQGEGGVSSFVDNGFVKGLRKLCDEHGILLICDEVQCGVGRTGKLFAHEWAGIIPDIMTIAKGIGGGFPLGACMATEKVAKTMTVGNHGSTYGGNPLATAVGNTVLDIVADPKFLESVNNIAAYLENKLNSLKEKYPEKIAEFRGKGLMRGIKLKDGFANTDFVIKARKHNILINIAGDNVVRLLPPLVIEQKHVDQAIAIFADVLEEL